MNSSDEVKFAYGVRQVLNEGNDALEPKVLARLQSARREAVNASENVVITRLSLAGTLNLTREAGTGLRFLAMALALSIGGIGTYYWNQFDEATQNEEIDSALLADELPPDAYVDTGFKVWLEKDSDSTPLK